jgi:[acyl-carrier-protein] S-malonyltransferase
VGLALLFPGQGTQHPLMLPWLDSEPAARDLLQRLSAALGADWRSRLADPDWATSNQVAQPLLVGVQLAAWASLAPHLPQPVVVAGYSVGELAAFGAAGVFDSATALDLAQVRARAMDRSAEGRLTGMLAVRDMPLAAIDAWCARHGLAVAIRLGPDRAVVGGLAASLESAALEVVVTGRLTPMAVRIASHTPWMRPAAAAFAEHLRGVALQPARVAVACDLTGGGVRRADELEAALAQQIDHTVLWDMCMETVLERGATCVLEVGPGTTLSTMWRNRSPHIPARSIDEFKSAPAAIEWALKMIGRGH